MLNLKGERLDFVWDLAKKKPPMKMDPATKTWDEAICRVNLRDRPAVFEVFAQGPTHARTFPYPFRNWWGEYGADWAFEMRGGYEFEKDFWTFSHWPISKIPYDESVKTNGKYLREPSHVSLLPVAGSPEVKGPTTWAMLIGLADPGNDEDLRDRTRSWLFPGKVKVLDSGFHFAGNNVDERALVFVRARPDQPCRFTLEPASQTRIIHPVFKIMDWGDRPVSVTRDGKRLAEGRDFRAAIVGKDAVVWMDMTLDQPATFMISARERDLPQSGEKR
jgi:hypothetical protein